MSDKGRAVLYAFWLSSCSWRVRAVLNIKKIAFEERPIDILKQRQQMSDQYRVLNPAQKVPALEIDNVTLVESMAIVQYLDETRPDPPLTYKCPVLRARVREICEIVVSGIQPLQNMGIKSHFETEEEFRKFSQHWTVRGLETLEQLLKKSAGRYCVGDEMTVADICLVPQLYNAVSRFSMNFSKYPTVARLYEELLNEKVFQETHPQNVRPKKVK